MNKSQKKIILPALPFNFYGAVIATVAIGPRREITLSMELWPQDAGQLQPSFKQGDGIRIKIRFSGIENFEQVKQFFLGWEEKQIAHSSLHSLRYDRIKPSKPKSLFFEIEFDQIDDRISIHCQNYTVFTERLII